MSLLFNGSSHYLTADVPNVSSVGSFSVWVRSNSWVQFGKVFDVDGVGNEERLHLQTNTSGSGQFALNGSVTLLLSDATWIPQDGLWHHIAVTWDSGGSNPYAIGYRDGVSHVTRATTFTSAVPTGSIYIGRRYTATQYWNGEIADLAFFNIRLSAEQILAIKSGSPVAIYKPLHYWPLHGRSSNEPDLGGSANTATAIGSPVAGAAHPAQGRYVQAPRWWPSLMAGGIGDPPVIETVPTQQAALGAALPIVVAISAFDSNIATVRFDCDVAKGTVDVSDLAGTTVSLGTRGTEDFTVSGTHAQCVAVARLMTYTPLVETGSDTTVRVTADNGTSFTEETFTVEFWYMLVEALLQSDLNATLATLTALNAVAETQQLTAIATDAGGRTGQDIADVITQAVPGAPVVLPTAVIGSLSTLVAGLVLVVNLLAAVDHTFLVTAGVTNVSGAAGVPTVSIETRERTFALRSMAT